MAVKTSQLIVELLDRVSAPARRVNDSLRSIRATASVGGPASFTDRLNGAQARTNERLSEARAGIVDAVGAFYALRTAIGAPVQAAMEFESAMADVKKVVDFAGEGDIRAFEKGLMDLSKRVPMAVNGLAQIAAAAGQAGIAKDDILDFTEAAAKIGVAFDISADESGQSMAKLMTGLGMTLPEVISLADAMNYLSNAQASNAAEILDIVREVGAQGKQYGFTADQVAAFGSAMVSSGAQTNVAATSFMNMGLALTSGESATKRQQAAYKALGMDATKVAKAMQKDAVRTTVSVIEAISKLPAEQQAAISSDLFGGDARALGPLLTNLDLLRESLGLVGDESKYAGSAFGEFDLRAKTVQNRMQFFRSSLNRIGITIGTALLPMLTDLMDRIEPVINAVSEWASRNPELVSGILAATAALVAFKGALAAMRFAGLLGASGALTMIATGMNTVGAAGGRLWGAARASLALQDALAKMDGVARLGGLARMGVALRGMLFAVPGVSMIASALTAVGAALATVTAPVWGAIAIAVAAVAAAGALLWKYWDRVSSVMSGVGRAIGEILAPAIEAAWPVIEPFAALGDLIAAGFGKAMTAVSDLASWVASFFQREVLTEEQKAGYEKAGYDAIMDLWNGMKRVMSDLTAWVQAKSDGLLAPFKSMSDSIASYFNMGNNGGEGVSGDPMGAGIDGARAGGGPIRRGGTYLVGEQGPELITASRDGFVHNARQTGAMLGGPGRAVQASAPTINLGGVTIHAAPGMDAREIAAEVMRRIEEKAATAFRGVQADTGMEAY